MDLRTKRTLRSLREAFYELRRELPLERVTVRALCERAEVGKATFYLHYHSVYDLSEELQEQVVQDIVDGLERPVRVLDDTTGFTDDLFSALVAHADQIDLLFSGSQEHALIEHIERALRKKIVTDEPSLADDRRFNVLLTYQVHGSHAAYMRYAREGDEKDRAAVVDAIVQASAAVARLW